MIRPARADDIDAMTAVSLRAKQSNGYDDAFMAQCVAELTVTAEMLAQRDYWVAAQELDGTTRLIGLAALEVIEPAEGEVHAFYIDPDFQRQGVGARLWQTLLHRAQALGLHELRLDADPNAVPFYRSIGFEKIGEAPSGSIPGRMLPHMCLLL